MSRVDIRSATDRVLERAEDIVAEIERRSIDGSLTAGFIDNIIPRVEALITNVRRLQQNSTIVTEVINGLINLLRILRSDNGAFDTCERYVPSRVCTGEYCHGYIACIPSIPFLTPNHTDPFYVYIGLRGQPSYEITNDQLEYLLVTLNLPVPRAAQCLGVSTRTIRRRMSQSGISRLACYNRISDQQLDDLLHSVIHRYPNSGYRMMLGHLRSMGITIQERRMRRTMIRVNPVGVSSRWSQHRAIHRRVYSVAHSNALWHIDGNHSLVDGVLCTWWCRWL